MRARVRLPDELDFEAFDTFVPVHVEADKAKKADLYRSCLTLSATQDSLLQSHRALFFSVTSVLMAICLFLIREDPVLGGIAALFFSSFYFYWRTVTLDRAEAVFFFHRQLLLLERGEPAYDHPFRAFKAWQRLPAKDRNRIKATDTLWRLLSRSKNRKKRQAIEWMFLSCWFAVVSFALLKISGRSLTHFVLRQ